MGLIAFLLIVLTNYVYISSMPANSKNAFYIVAGVIVAIYILTVVLAHLGF